jgi:hypothetical protein
MKNKDDLLLDILHSPMNAQSNNATVMKNKKDVDPFEDKADLDSTFTFGKTVEEEDKYKARVRKMMEEDPTMVLIDTPRGKMTLAEAIREGYNPETGEFEDELLPPNPEDMDMDPETLAKLEQLMMMPEGAREIPGGMMPPGMGEEMPMTEEEMMMEEQMAMAEGEGLEEELMALEQGGMF